MLLTEWTLRRFDESQLHRSQLVDFILCVHHPDEHVHDRTDEGCDENR